MWEVQHLESLTSLIRGRKSTEEVEAAEVKAPLADLERNPKAREISLIKDKYDAFTARFDASVADAIDKSAKIDGPFWSREHLRWETKILDSKATTKELTKSLRARYLLSNEDSASVRPLLEKLVNENQSIDEIRFAGIMGGTTEFLSIYKTLSKAKPIESSAGIDVDLMQLLHSKTYIDDANKASKRGMGFLISRRIISGSQIMPETQAGIGARDEGNRGISVGGSFWHYFGAKKDGVIYPRPKGYEELSIYNKKSETMQILQLGDDGRPDVKHVVGELVATKVRSSSEWLGGRPSDSSPGFTEIVDDRYLGGPIEERDVYALNLVKWITQDRKGRKTETITKRLKEFAGDYYMMPVIKPDTKVPTTNLFKMSLQEYLERVKGPNVPNVIYTSNMHEWAGNVSKILESVVDAEKRWGFSQEMLPSHASSNPQIAEYILQNSKFKDGTMVVYADLKSRFDMPRGTNMNVLEKRQAEDGTEKFVVALAQGRALNEPDENGTTLRIELDPAQKMAEIRMRETGKEERRMVLWFEQVDGHKMPALSANIFEGETFIGKTRFDSYYMTWYAFPSNNSIKEWCERLRNVKKGQAKSKSHD